VEGQVKKKKKNISNVLSLWWHILVALRQTPVIVDRINLTLDFQ